MARYFEPARIKRSVKEHQCHRCKGSIGKGSDYVDYEWTGDGGYYKSMHLRFHLPCGHEIRERFRELNAIEQRHAEEIRQFLAGVDLLATAPTPPVNQ